jgi:CdiI N-terminal domain
MAFSIGLLSDPVPDLDQGVVASHGLIEIGSFQERFIASLMYWKADDYERHWKQALARIVESFDASCLITSIVNPSVASHLFWWPMYRVQDTVYIQHHILFFDTLSSPFNQNDPYSSIPRRRIIDEDGNHLSEWSVTTKDIESFLQEIVLRKNAR